MGQSQLSKEKERLSDFTIPDNTGALKVLKKNPNDNSETIKFKLIEKKKVSHDTFIFVFEIPDDNYLGINICEHISIDAIIKTKDNPEGEEISRKYTPISSIKIKGKIEILIKVYFKNTHPKFPEGGIMTQHLNQINVGENVDFRGPFGKLKYLGDGNFEKLIKIKPRTLVNKNYKHLVCLAGGTGITPFYQIMQAAYLNNDKIKITLIFGNRSTSDLLLKKEIDDLIHSKLLNLKVVYTIDTFEEGWTGEVGFINSDMIFKYVDNIDNENTFVMVCGPPLMVDSLKTVVGKMGVKDDNFHSF